MHETSQPPKVGEPPAVQENPPPSFSIVVPVRNEEPHLRNTLESLLAQQVPPSYYEILIVDGDSEDGTPALIAEYAQRSPSIRALRNPKRVVAGGRNVGISEARGQLIAIVDGHCRVDGPSWLSKLARVFAETGADCVGFPQPLDAEGSGMQRAIALARSSILGRHAGSFNYVAGERFVPALAAAVAYKATVFDAIGGFDESFDATEDMELNYRVDRAGMRCYFTSAIRTYYQPRPNLLALGRQQWRYGRGRARLCRKHPATFAVATFLPSVALLVFALSFFLLSPRLVATLAVVYVLAVSISAAWTALRSGALRLLPAIVASLVIIHVGAAFGSLWELVRGTPSGGSPARQPSTSLPGRSGQVSST